MKKKKDIISVFALVLLSCMLVSCNNKNKNDQVVLEINDEKIYEPEFMLYLIGIQDRFEELAGEDVWSIEDFSGGKTAEEVAKDGAINNLIHDQIVLAKAESLGISLTSEVKASTEAQAISYFEANQERFKEFNITKEIVTRLILDQQLALEVKEAVVNNDSNLPDEARIQDRMDKNALYAQLKDIDVNESLGGIEVNYIVIMLSEFDTKNEVIPFSEEERKKALEKVTVAHDLALSGTDFESLISTYSEESQKDATKGIYNFTYIKLDDEDKIFFLPDSAGEYDLSADRLNDKLKAVLMGLEPGDVSDIAETQTGYHFFKVRKNMQVTEEKITTYEQAFNTMVNNLRKTAISELKEEGFEVIYNDWKNETDIYIDQTVYNAIKIVK